MICSSNSHRNIGRGKEIFSQNLKFCSLFIMKKRLRDEKVWVLSTQNQTLHCERGEGKFRRVFNNKKRIIIFIITSHHIYILLIQKYLHFLLLWQHLDMLWLVVATPLLMMIKFWSTHSHVMYASSRGYLRHNFINKMLQE